LAAILGVFPQRSFAKRPATIIFLAQRRKDAKKNQRNAAALCVFAPLPEKSSSHQSTFLYKAFAAVQALP
jgi:hypothetical protein